MGVRVPHGASWRLMDYDRRMEQQVESMLRTARLLVARWPATWPTDACLEHHSPDSAGGVKCAQRLQRIDVAVHRRAAAPTTFGPTWGKR